jgi:hypothetical protein
MVEEFMRTCRPTKDGKKGIGKLVNYGKKYRVCFFENALGRTAPSRP